jgi:hypothetical protein
MRRSGGEIVHLVQLAPLPALISVKANTSGPDYQFGQQEWQT